MSEVPAVSVVIPLYNKGPYIARALTSVLTQTFQDFEVIVVDDGSTDDGAEVVRGFDDPRIRLIQQENQGVSAARNKGVEESKAEFIAFLDADDYWTPTHLETLVRLIRRYPDAGIFSTAYNFVKPNGRLVWPKYRGIPPSPWEGKIPSYFKFAALTDLALSTSSLAIPKVIFWEMGGFQIGLNTYEDSELWAKIALKYPVIFSWQVGSICDIYACNRLSNRMVFIEHPFIHYVNKNVELERLNADLRADLLEYIAYLTIYYAECCLMKGDRTRAKESLNNCSTRLLQKQKIIRVVLAALPTPLFTILWQLKRKIGVVLFQRDYGSVSDLL